MGDSVETLIFPSKGLILKHNRRVVTTSQGYQRTSDNLRQEGSLDWVLDAIRYQVYGTDRYPTATDKAAILAWTIIEGHVFFDGNKRTGIFAMETFLLSNGYELNYSTEEIVEIALKIANHDAEPYPPPALGNWLNEHISKSS